MKKVILITAVGVAFAATAVGLALIFKNKTDTKSGTQEPVKLTGGVFYVRTPGFEDEDYKLASRSGKLYFINQDGTGKTFVEDVEDAGENSSGSFNGIGEIEGKFYARKKVGDVYLFGYYDGDLKFNEISRGTSEFSKSYFSNEEGDILAAEYGFSQTDRGPELKLSLYEVSKENGKETIIAYDMTQEVRTKYPDSQVQSSPLGYILERKEVYLFIFAPNDTVPRAAEINGIYVFNTENNKLTRFEVPGENNIQALSFNRSGDEYLYRPYINENQSRFFGVGSIKTRNAKRIYESSMDLSFRGWTEDDRVVFRENSSGEKESSAVYVMNKDGKNKQEIFKSDGTIFPDVVSFSGDQYLILLGTFGGSELVVKDLASGQAVSLDKGRFIRVVGFIK